MLELYHNDMSTCSQKVRLALAEKDIEWNGHELDLRKGDQHAPAYLKIHPGAVVPAIVHDGVPVIESTVINEFLDDAYPATGLRPNDAHARARMRGWTKQLDEGVHYATGVISLATAFRFQFAHYSPAELAAHIARIPEPQRRERHQSILEMGLDSPLLDAAIRRYDKLLGDMEAALADGPWLAGDEFSLADIAYTPYLTRLEHLQFLAMLDARPKLAAWYDRVRARPSYGTAITAWLNDKYLPLMKEKGAEAWPTIRSKLAAG